MFPTHLKEDDIVVSKESSSEVMILQHLSEKEFEAYCIWFDQERKKHGGWFKTASLVCVEVALAARRRPHL